MVNGLPRASSCSENARRIFEFFLDKNEDISGSNRQNELRSFQNEDKCIWLRMVQARRPGKFFSRRMTGFKVGVLASNLEVVTWKLKHSKFQRPCRGLSPGKGFAPTKRNQIACRDDKAIFYSTSTGANCSEYAWRIFQNLFHKNEDISRSCLRISLRSFQFQFFCM